MLTGRQISYHRFNFGHVSKMYEGTGIWWVLIMQSRFLLNLGSFSLLTILFPLLSFPMLSGRRQLLRKGNASNCWGSLHLDDLFVKNESFFPLLSAEEGRGGGSRGSACSSKAS